MLNQRDRRQLAILARHLAEDDPALVEAFRSWRSPATEPRFSDLTLTRGPQQGEGQPRTRFPAAAALRRWWGALFTVCGIALISLTTVGMMLGVWQIVALCLATLSGVFGLAALGFWLSYRNAVSGRRHRRRRR